MLFNSYAFIFGFLPLSLLAYHGIRHAGLKRSALFALTLLSFCFYGWWNPVYILLLVPLMLANYAVAMQILPQDGRHPRLAKAFLIAGLTGNLAALGYFKYANFFVNNVNVLFGANLFLAKVVLPLGISFFTFQKIAFLVDAYRGKVDRLNLLDFSLFVSFFPQLIAGPIVHHSEMLPQFQKKGDVPANSILKGLTIFAIGLAKKTLLADTVASYATPQFAAAAVGAKLTLFAAWTGALAYSAQLYFDFSGYCDMAIGAALLFGMRLPVNFDSPYKAISIIDFWRRWHITLSRFLRDYLYIPLGGNRCGSLRRYSNLMITMLLGGFWHGAAWTFVIWGALHGLYLLVNHAWRVLFPQPASTAGKYFGWIVTFLAIVVAWVFFRASDVGAAWAMLRAMTGGNGITASTDSVIGLIVAILFLMLAWVAPNTQEITSYVGPEGLYGKPAVSCAKALMHWKPVSGWAVITGCLLAVAIMSLSRVSEFLYFQF